MTKNKTFVSIGAGNVATHLVKALCSKGYPLIQVYSRTEGSAEELAEKYNAEFTNSTDEIKNDADFYIVSLPDQVLPGFLNQFEINNKLVFHTAGSHGLEVFGSEFRHFGVMYPLQTFTKKASLDISGVPLLIEANNTQTLEKIEMIARDISARVYATDSESRRWLHLAAVFACNFTNHMRVLSDEILSQKNLDPALLKPLIDETYKKSLGLDPVGAQTGPAVRNDYIIMDKHIKMLENQPLLQKIYTFTSESIIRTKSSQQNKKV
jgi:predicted short-subunit dehydrogenase-like oxidoreductase (DUF2520 family)